ncbi:uncharacterized protein LOC132066513 [Lycium ferocissimum]|uniref:uncharacterized protein LOC132066513 n=1 Tax=Lycium ferocissimum TaxID=112874 RepID=UPI002815B6B4|nr:uncharacterized protein LOC132066513 [Lycium ferocissimum]
MRFGKKGKLSPRYIGPYRILQRIRQVAYELELPPELAAVHPVFHVSMLKKFMGDPSLDVSIEITGVKDSLSYEEIPVAILDRQVFKLRTKEIASVKVLWRNQKVEEATWEAKEDMKSNISSVQYFVSSVFIQFSSPSVQYLFSSTFIQLNIHSV